MAIDVGDFWGPAQSYAIITPGGDAYEEAVSGFSGLRLMDNAAPIYSADFVGDNEVVQFQVPMSDKTLRDEINAARHWQPLPSARRLRPSRPRGTLPGPSARRTSHRSGSAPAHLTL